MSPDELLALRERRLAQLEADVARLQERSEAQEHRITLLEGLVRSLTEQVRALWDENRWIRRLLIASMVTVTTGAIGTATVVFVKVGGGPG